jgi:hypothetical protein
VIGSCEHSNKPLDYIKSGVFLDHLSDLSAFARTLALWSSL